MDKEVHTYKHTHTHTHTYHIHKYNGILFSIKKKWNGAMCSNMDGPKDYQTKWSRLEKERQISYRLYAESKIWNKLTYLQNRHTDIENRLVVSKEEESWGVMNWEFEINRSKLWYIGNKNKILSYHGYSKQDATIQHRELHSVSCNKP